MELKDRLKARRTELDMTLEEVAKTVGVTRATIQKYETGVISNIPFDKIELLAKALLTTPAYLMGWPTFGSELEDALARISKKLNVPISELKERFLSKRADSVSEPLALNEENLLTFFSAFYDIPNDKNTPTTAANILPMPRFVKKPRLGTIACGKPILAVEEVEEYDDVPEGIDCDFTLKCKGDSMINARIFDGDIVYIKEQPLVENGQIAAVIVEEEATLKKVYYTPGSDRITLQACNPLYADMVYEGETLDHIRILGRAVAFTSPIRDM